MPGNEDEESMGNETSQGSGLAAAGRTQILAQDTDLDSDDWNGFWKEYGRALGIDIQESNQRVVGGWEGGVEEGLPLEWHFRMLRENGFTSVDYFWRHDCDEIYGGINSGNNTES